MPRPINKNISNISIKKTNVAIVSLGPFLEYFYLKIYICLAVVLNALFLPPEIKFIDATLAYSLIFCSSFLFRPIGALVIGYIGDKYGRRHALFLNGLIMTITCFGIYLLPEYAKIGVWASVLMLLLRVLQSMSSIGDMVGSQLYLTESAPYFASYQPVTMMTLASTMGGTVALLVSIFYVEDVNNWRYIFLVGAILAFIYTCLVFFQLDESKDFINNKQKKHTNDPIDKKLLSSYFFMRCLYPFSIYLSFAYAPVMLAQYNYSASDIIFQNFIVAIIDCVFTALMIHLANKHHPLRILRILSIIYGPILCVMMPLMELFPSPTMIFIFQVIAMCACPSTIPAEPIIFKCFPVSKRFRALSITFALASAFICIFSTFYIVKLVATSKLTGLYIVIIPLIILYIVGLNNFTRKAIEKGEYEGFLEGL